MKPTAPIAPDAGEVQLDPATLFAGLSGKSGLVVAVSGGPDSTALMQLIAGWATRPPVLVVCVDHRLRQDSAAEAETVAANAAALGLPCRTMRADPPPGRGNLQDWARRQRFRLLAEAAAAAGCDTIVTAHHRDDQAETFLLRLARGSGVYGLAAMAAEGFRDGLRVAHPLLDVPRAALHVVAAASGLPLAADPSNRDARFDRVRMRRLMPALAQAGLTAPRLAATAAAMRRAADALDHYATALLRAHFHADPSGAVEGSAAALRDAPEEVSLRALAMILKAVGGADVTPPLDGLLNLRAALVERPAGAAFKRTLHGATVAMSGGDLRVSREWGRKGLPQISLAQGDALVWDGRFRVAAPESGLAGQLTVAPLGRAGRRLRSPAFAPAAMRVLPGMFADGELAAVPRSVFAADDGAPLQALIAECLVGGRLGLGPRTEPRSP